MTSDAACDPQAYPALLVLPHDSSLARSFSLGSSGGQSSIAPFPKSGHVYPVYVMQVEQGYNDMGMAYGHADQAQFQPGVPDSSMMMDEPELHAGGLMQENDFNNNGGQELMI